MHMTCPLFLGSCSCSLTSTLENLRQWHCHQWISVQTSTASQERSGRFDGAKWDFIHDRLWLFQMLRLWRSELVPDSVSSKVQLHSKVHGSTCERRLLNDYSPSRTIFFLSTLGRLWPLTETKLDFEMSPRTASNDDVSFSNWTGVMQVTVTCWMGLWNASSAHIKKSKGQVTVTHDGYCRSCTLTRSENDMKTRLKNWAEFNVPNSRQKVAWKGSLANMLWFNVI